MKNQIKQSDILTVEKVKRDFTRHKSFYFTEVVYDKSKKFFDLYLKFNRNEISKNQIEIYNELNKNLEKYLSEVNNYLKSTLTNSKHNKATELNTKDLTIDVVEIQDDNKNFDAVLVCGKQYKYLGLIKKGIGIRVEIKGGRIISMERKTDTTIKNRN